MKKVTFIRKFFDFVLKGKLDEKARKEVRELVFDCFSSRKNTKKLYQLVTEVDFISEPSDQDEMIFCGYSRKLGKTYKIIVTHSFMGVLARISYFDSESRFSSKEREIVEGYIMKALEKKTNW